MQSEVVALVVERSVEPFLSELCERVDGVADVAGGDGRLGNFEQSLMTEAGVASPQGVHRMGVGSVGNGQAVLQYVDVGGGQSDLNFARAIGAGCVEHHVAVAFFFRMRRRVVFLCGGVHAYHKEHHAAKCCSYRFHAIDCLGLRN